MNLQKALAAVAGARTDLAEDVRDLPKQAAMGGVLVSTALVAGISAFFALNTTLHLVWPVAAVAGAVWALVILNLDRMLIISMNGMGSTALKLWAAVPRLLLAIVIGAVISTPLTLRIFSSEINAELKIMQAQQLTASRVELDKTYGDIPNLQSQVDRLRAVASGQQRPSVSDDPDVKSAQATYDDAAQKYQDAQANAQCELNGTCGTHVQGGGDAFRQAQATANAAKQNADRAKSALDDAQQKAAARLDTAAAQQADDARRQLPGLQSQLDAEEGAKQAADQAAASADNANSGVLSQLEALDAITTGHPLAMAAHALLFLLFMFIEVLPVVTKLLSTVGGPSAYDYLVTQDEEEFKERKRSERDRMRERVAAEADARDEVYRHQLDKRVASQKQVDDIVVEEQSKIAEKSMRIWAELAKARVDAELKKWIWENSSDLPPTNGRPPGPPPPPNGRAPAPPPPPPAYGEQTSPEPENTQPSTTKPTTKPYTKPTTKPYTKPEWE